MPPERKPLTAPIYERQDDEGDEAWAAFRTYRDQGPDRTLDSTRSKLGKESGYLRQVEEWSSVWSWGRRTTEWERHLDTKRRAAAERKVVEMAERHAQQAETLLAGLWPFIEALEQRAGGLDITDMKPQDLAVLVKELTPAWKAGMEAERKARGMEDITVRHMGTVVVSDLRAAFSERLKRRETIPVHGGDATASGDDGQPEPGAAATA